MVNQLPKRLAKYFWDVNLNQLNPLEDADFLIKRILERGETQDIFWLKRQFGLEKIAVSLKKYRDFSRKTGLFWTLLLNLNQSEVPCLQTPYRRIRYGV
ncbi:MAG: hypothetical protein NTZ93_00035 [Candidatus Beckwithbacteria bacterium]|nr:hypothetical protein [Candidatus Beckwithbacteria bacterium]